MLSRGASFSPLRGKKNEQCGTPVKHEMSAKFGIMKCLTWQFVGTTLSLIEHNQLIRVVIAQKVPFVVGFMIHLVIFCCQVRIEQICCFEI